MTTFSNKLSSRMHQKWCEIHHNIANFCFKHECKHRREIEGIDSVSFSTSVSWEQPDKTCHAQSPTGACANSSQVLENNELIVHNLIPLSHFFVCGRQGLFLGTKARRWTTRAPTWLDCNGVEKKMTAHLMTGVKRLWRRQNSRTPCEEQEREFGLFQRYALKVRF